MIHPPILVRDVDCGDLFPYRTVPEAEAALEPIDVRNDVYEGFDSAGHRLNIATDGKRISITADETSAEDPHVFASLINSLLEVENLGADVHRASEVKELVELAQKHFKAR